MGKNSNQTKLVFVGKPFEGRVCVLELETTTVGRSSQNHLSIQDPSVSAKHCEILAHDPEIIVRDLKSSNGTFVNGVRIDGQSQLKDGQIVRFGNVSARLELAPPDDTRSTADATAIYQHAKFTREARAERENPKPAPQPVKLDGSGGHAEGEDTVSIRREPASVDDGTSRTPSHGQASTRQASSKWLILAGLIVAAAILWWMMRK